MTEQYATATTMPSPIANNPGNEPDNENPPSNDSGEEMTLDSNTNAVSADMPPERVEEQQGAKEPNVKNETDMALEEECQDSMEIETVEEVAEEESKEDVAVKIDGDNVDDAVVVLEAAPNDEESGNNDREKIAEDVDDDAAILKLAPTDKATKNIDNVAIEKDGSTKNDVESAVETNNDAIDWKEQKKLGELFDVALDKLQEKISASILAFRSDEHERAQNTFTEDKQKKSNSIYASLSDTAKETYHALIRYGSKSDLSFQGSSARALLSETRRARLTSTGKNMWMTIRSNPELFDDVIREESGNGGDYLAFEGRKFQAAAGGYVRAVAAQLVFLDYIDTTCGAGVESAPSLHALGECEREPSVKELVFGLKVFSRAGKAILTHSKNDPQASHNTLSLAVSCFQMIREMSSKNGEAADEAKDLLDEAFDAFSLLPNAAFQFGECAVMTEANVAQDWPSLVVKHLKQAKKLLDDFCGLQSDDGRLTVSKIAILQRYLPSLARLCYKHGSQLVKIDVCDHASSALHIALETTNSCLAEVRSALKRENDPLNEGTSRKSKELQLQVLHNLEADLVVVSIEAFYVLSHIFQSSGKQEKALQCLDMIEQYMKEQRDRDDELYATAMSKVDNDLFSEGNVTASALEGPKKQDKLDIKSRASTVRANAKSRHAQEKATLAFCRLMIYHKMPPNPGTEEESIIDQLICEMTDLCKSIKTSNSTVLPAHQNIGITVFDSKNAASGDHIFTLTLNAIRVVHVRRITSNSASKLDSRGDPYKVILEKLPKSDSRRPFVLLDRLNALLTARFQMEGKISTNSALDHESLHMAREFTDTVKTMFEQTSKAISKDNSETTLFVDSSECVRQKIFEDAKAHFARGVSLYHSSNVYTLCAEYAGMLEQILGLHNQSSVDFQNNNARLGEVTAIKAYSLSMIGKISEAYSSSQAAWELVKSIDTMKTLFHCSLVHQIKFSTSDTLLELDTAINDLLLNGFTTDEIIASFPHLSNSCVDSGKGAAELVLLGLQERWIKMLLTSNTLRNALQEKPNNSNEMLLGLGQHNVMEILRAYLENFEYAINVQDEQDQQKALAHCETLLQVIEITLGFVVTTLRDTKQRVQKSRRKKKEGEQEFILIWDDDVVKKIVGNRTDCVWVAEQLWNLSNKLMMSNFGTSGKDTRIFSSTLFAGAHDFCLLSEEEEQARLSKDFLDIDIQPDKMATPTFHADKVRSTCDISSEFSGQCLLLAAANAVDFVTNNSNAPDNKKVLRRSLHHLTWAQDEFFLNSEDKDQNRDVNKMIAMLVLRCLLGIGDETLAHDVLKSGGLEAFLDQIYNDESSYTDKPGGVLQNVYLVACGAEEKNMMTFGAVLLRSCASYMTRAFKFSLHIAKNFSIELADIQRKVIQSAPATKDVIEVYRDIVGSVKRRKDETGSFPDNDASFYSKDDLNWFAIEAYNQGVSITLLGDHQNAGTLFTSALAIIPLCSSEVQGHTKSMNAALSNSLSHSSMNQSLSSITTQVSL